MASAFAADSVIVKKGYWLRVQPCNSGKNCPEGVRITREAKTGEVLRRNADWALVKIDGKSFWIFSEALQDGEGSAGETQAQGENEGGQTGQIYNPLRNDSPIRSKAGTQTAGSTIIGSVDKNTSLEVIGSEKDGDGDLWYKVRYTSGGSPREGFIFSGKVKPENDSETEAGDCPDGNCAGQGNVNVGNNQEVGAVAAGDAKGHKLSLPIFNARCSVFLNSSGLGTWGKAVVSAAKRVAPNCMYNNKLFNGLCKNYRGMSEVQKNTFLALVFASIGQQESSCDPTEHARGTNDRADGMFGLEYSAHVRRYRSVKWCKANIPTNSQAMKFQTECAVSIISDTICEEGNSITDGDGYWDQLRGNGRIARHIRDTAAKWGLCK